MIIKIWKKNCWQINLLSLSAIDLDFSPQEFLSNLIAPISFFFQVHFLSILESMIFVLLSD